MAADECGCSGWLVLRNVNIDIVPEDLDSLLPSSRVPLLLLLRQIVICKI